MKFHGLFPESNKQDWRSPAQASLAGRNDGGTSPPFDVNSPRQPKTQEGHHSVMPSGTKSGSNLPVSPLEGEE